MKSKTFCHLNNPKHVKQLQMLTESDRLSRFWHCYKKELKRAAPPPPSPWVCTYSHTHTGWRPSNADTHTHTHTYTFRETVCSSNARMERHKRKESFLVKSNELLTILTHFPLTCTHCSVTERKVTDLFRIVEHFLYWSRKRNPAKEPIEKFRHPRRCI